jgi:DNA-binding protein HU-beta
MNMTKADLVGVVAKKASLTNKAAKEAVNAVFDSVEAALKKGEKVVLTGFGTFSVRNRKARPGRNPRTGQAMQIAARRTPGFTAGKTLKKAVR